MTSREDSSTHIKFNSKIPNLKAIVIPSIESPASQSASGFFTATTLVQLNYS